MGVAATGGVALGVVTAAGATSPPAVTLKQASISEALGLDQQVISLSEQEVNLETRLESARRAAAAEVASTADPGATQPTSATTAVPGATNPGPTTVATVPPSGPPAPTTTTPSPGDDDPTPEPTPTPTSAPPVSTTTQVSASTTTTTTTPPTTTTTRPRHGGGGGGGD